MNPIFEIGSWSIQHSSNIWLTRPAGHDYCIVHDCDSPTSRDPERRDTRYLRWVCWRHFNIPCARCGEAIPKEIQGIWVMMTGDMDLHIET